jgi:hypothetical protein
VQIEDIHIGDVEDGAEDGSRTNRLVDRQPCELAELAAVFAQGLHDVGIKGAHIHALGRVDSRGNRRHRRVVDTCRQRQSTAAEIGFVGADGIAAPSIATLDQGVCSFAPVRVLDDPDLELIVKFVSRLGDVVMWNCVQPRRLRSAIPR